MTKAEVKVIDGTSYLPLRVAAELLGSEVKYDDSTKTITIQPKGNEAIDSYITEEFVLTQLKVETSKELNSLVTVDITNTSKIDYQNVDLSISFFDKSGNRISAVTTNVFWLRAGEQQLVQLSLENVDLSGYDHVRFSVDRKMKLNY